MMSIWSPSVEKSMCSTKVRYWCCLGKYHYSDTTMCSENTECCSNQSELRSPTSHEPQQCRSCLPLLCEFLSCNSLLEGQSLSRTALISTKRSKSFFMIQCQIQYDSVHTSIPTPSRDKWAWWWGKEWQPDRFRAHSPDSSDSFPHSPRKAANGRKASQCQQPPH